MSAKKLNSEVCCITLNMTDRLRLLACPPELTPKIRKAITKSWGRIQDETKYHGSHEFKLEGKPWQGQGHEAVPSRRLLAAILSTMAKNGFNLIQSAGISKKVNSKDSLFFERGQPDPDVSMFAMSFNMEDRIRIIDAPGFMPYLKKAVKTSWPGGIQSQKEYDGSLELKLGGTPWKCDGSQTVESRLLLIQILANFRSVGYKLYASADITEPPKENPHHPMHKGSLESWVFRKVNANWQ